MIFEFQTLRFSENFQEILPKVKWYPGTGSIQFSQLDLVKSDLLLVFLLLLLLLTALPLSPVRPISSFLRLPPSREQVKMELSVLAQG